MGKGGGGSAPPAPDYSSLAQQQAALNNQASYQQTVANRPTQVTPQGTLSWTNTPTMQKQLDALATQHLEVCQRKARDDAGGITYQVRGAALAIQPVRAS